MKTSKKYYLILNKLIMWFSIVVVIFAFPIVLGLLTMHMGKNTLVSIVVIFVSIPLGWGVKIVVKNIYNKDKIYWIESDDDFRSDVQKKTSLEFMISMLLVVIIITINGLFKNGIISKIIAITLIYVFVVVALVVILEISYSYFRAKFVAIGEVKEETDVYGDMFSNRLLLIIFVFYFLTNIFYGIKDIVLDYQETGQHFKAIAEVFKEAALTITIYIGIVNIPKKIKEQNNTTERSFK